eukprot:scaffold6821_cov127-Cylindrotheca_fusiformis.AAC.11
MAKQALPHRSWPPPCTDESSTIQMCRGMEDIDKFLAASMTKLSVKDRELTLEEVHGISRTNPEDLAFLEDKLDQLDAHLQKIKPATVYEKAELLNAAYVSRRNFRLMFLRCNRYEPRAAAEQMLMFFEVKRSLFGTAKLTKDITLLDLNDDDKESLQTGFCQILPVRDNGNRQIILFAYGLRTAGSPENDARAIYYVLLSALRSSEAKVGVISVQYAVGRHKDVKKGAGHEYFGQLAFCIPLRWAGVHVCIDDPEEYHIPLAVIRRVPPFYAAKFRFHHGSHAECMRALCGYGIPEGAIPISLEGAEPFLENHMRWYRLRMALDCHCTVMHNDCVAPNDPPTFGTQCSRLRSPDKLSVTMPSDDSLTRCHTDGISLTSGSFNPRPQGISRIVPLPEDVVFGETSKTHPGNVRLQQVVSEHAADYEALEKRNEKMDFALKLVHHMKSTGSRFLIRDPSTAEWVEVTDVQARNRVSKAIRNRRRTRSLARESRQGR